MKKVKIEHKYAPFPKPIALIGSLVDGKPNFMTIAWFNRMSMSPNIWMISIGKNHYTFKGIKENGTLSMNFPNPDLVIKTDYCGLVSGREKDKSDIFSIFYGELKTAPLIVECPISIELEVVEMMEKEDLVLIFAEVKNIFSEEKYLTNGELDPIKFKPLAFIKPNPEGYYYKLGQRVGQAWSIGTQLLKEE
jgi:flavin reductase (DIM6/NTAB) family NADH-FMN oxidoreductase RutF